MTTHPGCPEHRPNRKPACPVCMGLAVTEPTYGMCTACGSVEVRLNKRTDTRDLSAMGESATYPTGYGCEVCS